MLLGSDHHRKNDSWYWWPPPPLGAAFHWPPPPLTVSILPIHPSCFLPCPPHVKVTAPHPYAVSLKETSEGIGAELARGQAPGCILMSPWLGKGGGVGGWVLSRAATSSPCVESIFSSVNRGIPAHRSCLPSQDRAVGGCTRMDDTSLLLSPSAAAPTYHLTARSVAP